MSFFSTGSSGSCSIFLSSSLILGCVRHYQPPTSGGFTPWKNSQEIGSPIQITNPNRQTT